MRRFTGLAVLIAALAGALWWMSSAPTPVITFSEIRAHAIPGAPNSVMVTFSMDNRGGADRLTGVEAEGAELAMIKSLMAVGLPVPGDGPSQLSGEAGHIMLMGLETAPEPGALLPLDLTFARSGTVTVKARLGEMAMDHGRLLDVPADEAPTIALAVLPDGDGWRVEIALERFRMAPDMVDQPHSPGAGHAHLYVGGTKIGRLFETTARIGPLPTGRHTVEVTLNSNDHRTLAIDGAPIAASVEIDAR